MNVFNSRQNVCFLLFFSRTSLEDIEDEDDIEEYESEDDTVMEKKVRTTTPKRQIVRKEKKEKRVALNVCFYTTFDSALLTLEYTSLNNLPFHSFSFSCGLAQARNL